jgi:membrane protease YdiL (CAAX protease family)
MNEQTNDESEFGGTLLATAVRPPRVWTVFAAVALALFLAILFQAALGVAMAFNELARGTTPAELGKVITDKLTSPYVFMLLAGAGQLGFLIAGFLAAYWSKVPFRERVAWVRAHPSWRVYPLAMLGSIPPLAIGLASAVWVAKLIPPDDSIERMFEAMTIDAAIVFVIFIGLVPGVIEEVLFRGYMQQRLMKRWGAGTAIVMTSIIFAVFHVTPHAVVAVVPLAFWFGYLAWRSKSILPTIACHIFVNSGLNAWRMIVKFGELSETTQNTVHAGALLIGIICFAICCWPAFWRDRTPDAGW